VLDFFLDNWLVTLIMLWFLFGLFGQGNRQKAERQHQHPAAEKRRRELQKQQDVLRTEAERKKREITESVKRVAEQLEGRMEDARETLEVQSQETEETEKLTDDDSRYVREDPKPYQLETPSPYEQKVEKPYRRPNTHPYRPERQTVVNAFPTDWDSLKRGVIWAEILGKPRAKRPYRPPYVSRDSLR
jgi:hypothetical protein